MMSNKAVDYIFEKELKLADLIMSLSDDVEGYVSNDIKANNFFIITREKNDGRYYFVILEPTKKHMKIIYNEFTQFARYFNFLGEPEVDDIYDITSLTSADTMEELYKKFLFVYKMFK